MESVAKSLSNDPHQLRAEVAMINGLSAHADRGELLDWTAHLKKRPSHTFIVHGEEEASLAFAEALQQEQSFTNVAVPQLGQKFKI